MLNYKACGLYSGGTRFESRLNIVPVEILHGLSPSREMLEQQFKLGHGRFVPFPIYY
jgi:hypothetical protein